MDDDELTRRVSEGNLDPFNDRASRIVRHRLAEMLIDCLRRRQLFPGVSDKVWDRYPQRPYRDYIRDRTKRYRRATGEAQAADPFPLTQAAILWRHGLYFEVHELLEPHWRAASGDEREGLKGLIQAAGVYVHREAGHVAASVHLAGKAVARLRRYGAAIGSGKTMDIEDVVVHLERLSTACET